MTMSGRLLIAMLALTGAAGPLGAPTARAAEPIEVAKLPFLEIFSPTFFWNDEADFVRTGAFDRVLLRPRAAALQLAGYEVRLSRLGRLIQGVAVLVIASRLVPIHWDAAAVAMASRQAMSASASGSSGAARSDAMERSPTARSWDPAARAPSAAASAWDTPASDPGNSREA